jgi:Mn-dependent DtxR family transcriptional regulator
VKNLHNTARKEGKKMRFPNSYLNRIYKYLYINDGQTILLQDIAEDLNISRPTIRKYLKWLERRNIIERMGKKITILQY